MSRAFGKKEIMFLWNIISGKIPLSFSFYVLILFIQVRPLNSQQSDLGVMINSHIQLLTHQQLSYFYIFAHKMPAVITHFS